MLCFDSSSPQFLATPIPSAPRTWALQAGEGQAAKGKRALESAPVLRACLRAEAAPISATSLGLTGTSGVFEPRGRRALRHRCWRNLSCGSGADPMVGGGNGRYRARAAWLQLQQPPKIMLAPQHWLWDGSPSPGLRHDGFTGQKDTRQPGALQASSAAGFWVSLLSVWGSVCPSAYPLYCCAVDTQAQHSNNSFSKGLPHEFSKK